MTNIFLTHFGPVNRLTQCMFFKFSADKIARLEDMVQRLENIGQQLRAEVKAAKAKVEAKAKRMLVNSSNSDTIQSPTNTSNHNKD